MLLGDRIRRARQARDLTQTELADKVGVHQSAIAQYETDRNQPSADVLTAIALQTGFPPAHFSDTKRPAPEFPDGSLLFRSHQAVSKRRRVQAHQLGSVVFEAIMQVGRQAPPAPNRLPHLEGSGPLEAAALTRNALGVAPDLPIPNLLNVLERGGVTVIPLPLRVEQDDQDPETRQQNESRHKKRLGRLEAFSLWADGLQRPVIAYLQGAPADRLRLSVAHELGHLVLHQALRGDDPESEAYLFAGAFLIPPDRMRAELHPPITVSDLATMKAKWGVAMQAIAVYGNRLGILNDRQLRYLFMQLNKRGWRKTEPPNLAVPIEKPRAFRKMVEVVYGERADTRRLANELRLPHSMVDELLESYATRAELPRSPTPTTPPAPLQGANVVPFPRRGNG